MFYRYVDGRLRPMPIQNWWIGRDLFLVGGHPNLNCSYTLGLLGARGLVTMAMNNAAKLFQPTMWIGADRAQCYCPSILGNPAIMKFMAHHAEQKDRPLERIGMQPRHLPNLLLYTVPWGNPRSPLTTFCSDPGPEFGWWGSVFPLAVQMAWRLGFRRVFLVGCVFDSTGPEHYAWDAGLSAEQRHYSQRTYDADIERITKLLPIWEANRFEVVSCDEDCRAPLRYVPLVDAVGDSLRRHLPSPVKPGELTHASQLD